MLTDFFKFQSIFPLVIPGSTNCIQCILQKKLLFQFILHHIGVALKLHDTTPLRFSGTSFTLLHENL